MSPSAAPCSQPGCLLALSCTPELVQPISRGGRERPLAALSHESESVGEDAGCLVSAGQFRGAAHNSSEGAAAALSPLFSDPCFLVSRPSSTTFLHGLSQGLLRAAPKWGDLSGMSFVSRKALSVVSQDICPVCVYVVRIHSFNITSCAPPGC